MRAVAETESIDVNDLKKRVADGIIAIPANKNHKLTKPIGVGYGLTIKVNANIGTSPIKSDLKNELRKLDIAVKAGADTVMDLSLGGDLDEIRRKIIEHSPVPVGTVPIYQAVVEVKNPENLTPEKYLEVFEKNAEDGVDFATIHAGVTREALPMLEKRLMPSVSMMLL
jgi:phosphomethylpyrimidine synthase